MGGLLLVYILVVIMKEGGFTTNLINGQLVPICAYMIMAISLNLTVGILGELSLGHAGFMLLGAYIYAILTTPVASKESIFYKFGILKDSPTAGFSARIY